MSMTMSIFILQNVRTIQVQFLYISTFLQKKTNFLLIMCTCCFLIAPSKLKSLADSSLSHLSNNSWACLDKREFINYKTLSQFSYISTIQFVTMIWLCMLLYKSNGFFKLEIATWCKFQGIWSQKPARTYSCSSIPQI